MNKNDKIIINPFYNQFIYDIVYHAPREAKMKLSKKYLQAVRTPSTLKRFIAKASMEMKDEMLVQLGIQWVKVYFDRGYPQKSYLRDIFREYDIEKMSAPSMITTLIANRVYVTNDKHFAYQLGTMAHLQNHSIYGQSLLMAKAGYHRQRWQKEFDEKQTLEAEEHSKSAEYLVSTIFNAIQTYEFTEPITGLVKNDIKILFYLYYKKKFIHYDDLVAKFSGTLGKNKITSAIRRLCQGQYINKSVLDKKYEISSMGILQVNDFFQSVLKANEIN
jgi:hypothetical protein